MKHTKLLFLVMLMAIVSCNKEENENLDYQDSLTERLKEIGVEKVDSKMLPSELELLTFDSESEAFDFIQNLTVKTEDLDGEIIESTEGNQLSARGDCDRDIMQSLSRGLTKYNVRYTATINSAGVVTNIRNIETHISGWTAGYVWEQQGTPRSYVTNDGIIVTNTSATLTVGVKVGGMPAGWTTNQQIMTRYRPSPCPGSRGGANPYSTRPNAAQVFLSRAHN